MTTQRLLFCVLLALIPACHGAASTQGGSAGKPVYKSWGSVMEPVGNLFYGKLTLAAKDPRNINQVLLASEARQAAAAMREGIRRFAVDREPDFGQMAEDAADFFDRIEQYAADPAAVSRIFAGAEARYCDRCHDKYQ